MTATSNVHYNLSAWQASHAYSLSNRVSLGGNAYQVITAGTSAGSGGPTGTGSSITDGSVIWKWLSAIDYTSLSSWATGIPSTLTQPVVALLWNNGVITTTNPSGTLGVQFLQLQSKVTTSTNTITVKCAAGESFRDNVTNTTALAYNTANGVAFVMPSTGAGNINYFNILTDNTIIDGIQFQDPNSTSACSILNFNGDGARLQNCIVDGYSQASLGAFIIDTNASSGAITIANCLVIDRIPGGSQAGASTVSTSHTTVNFINNTLIAINSPTSCGGWDIRATGGTGVVKNCITIGYSAANIIQSAGQAVTSSNSVFSSASLTGTNVTTGSGNLFSKTAANQFVSATVDFRLKAGADAIDAGTTDATNIPTTDSINGTIRPQGSAWDAGCWEYFVATAGYPRLIMLD